MTKQKTLFSEQPEEIPDYIEPLPGCDSLDDDGLGDEPPYGPLMYLQELYASQSAVIGTMLARRRAEAVWRNYRQEEGKQQ